MDFVISFRCLHCGYGNSIMQNTDDESVGALNYIRKIVGTALNVGFYTGQVNTFTALRCQSCGRASGVMGFVYRDQEETESLSFDFEVSHEDLIKYSKREFNDSPESGALEALRDIQAKAKEQADDSPESRALKRLRERLATLNDDQRLENDER